jgi:heme exporter protein A
VVAGYGDTIVLDGLSLDVARGDVIALTGPNGAGKTTLLRLIAGLLRPHAGLIELDGGDPEAAVGQQAHLVGHPNAMKPRLTVAENLHHWAGILGGTSGDVETGLRSFDLDDLADVPVGYLSAGQRRRASLARLRAAPRPIWLLDEPTTALDATYAALVSAIIADHARYGGLVIAATHLPLAVPGARALHLTAVRERPS